MGVGGRTRRHRARGLHRQRRVPARTSGIRPARSLAVVGRRPGDHPTDDFQYRGDALHPRDGRTGVHRVHAHPAFVDVVGVGLRGSLLPPGRLARMGGHGGRRHLLSFCPAPGSGRRRVCHLRHRCRGVSGLRCHSHHRPANRAHARDSQLGAGDHDPRQFLRAHSALRPRTRMARGGGRGRWLRPHSRQLRSLAGGRRFLSPRCAGRLLGLRRRGEHRLVQLGARSRLRHGGTSRVHSVCFVW